MQRRELLLTCCALTLNRAARGTTSDEALWTALRAGGLALLLRHAATEPGVGDPPDFRIGDCTRQRNLSAAGRAQAARLGATLAARAVPVGAVLSSQWCRCIDTARLAFPQLPLELFPALNSFFEDRSAERQRTSDAHARIAAIVPPVNVALVTHQVNILALSGEVASAGEIIVVQPDARRLTVIGRLRIP
jgi:broad specificity phosphatase PhoE